MPAADKPVAPRKPRRARKGIFISYRRTDSAGEAGRLADHLGAAFGADTVFLDVAGIVAGDDWRQRLDTALDACDTMLVVLGRQWLTVLSAAHPALRRIDEPDDMVAWEVTRGLARGLRVVQVLVQGSAPLRAETLPPAMAGLAMRQSVGLRHENFVADVHELVEQVRRSRRVNSIFRALWQASDLTPWARVLDSGADATTAAITIVNALELLLARAGAAQPLSVRYLYEKARQHQPGSTPMGGLQMLPALFVAGFFGAPPEALWPYRAADSALPRGRSWRALDAHPGPWVRGDFFRCDGLSDAVRQLAAGRPVMAVCPVQSDTWFWPPCAQTGEVPMPARPGEVGSGGRTTVLLVGFDPAAQRFVFMGTWGTGWGRGGFGTMRLDVAQRTIEADSLWSVELTASTAAQLLEQRASAARGMKIAADRGPRKPPPSPRKRRP